MHRICDVAILWASGGGDCGVALWGRGSHPLRVGVGPGRLCGYPVTCSCHRHRAGVWGHHPPWCQAALRICRGHRAQSGGHHQEGEELRLEELEPAHSQRWGLGFGGLAERVSSAGRSLRLIPLNKFLRMARRGWSCRHAWQKSLLIWEWEKAEDHDRELRKACGCTLRSPGPPALGLQGAQEGQSCCPSSLQLGFLGSYRDVIRLTQALTSSIWDCSRPTVAPMMS